MPSRTKHQVGDVLGRWTLVKYIDSGGNGDVWRAETDGRPPAALKILHRTRTQDYERFRREVAICQSVNPADVGILPVIDSNLPERPTASDRPWFTMPLASDLTIALVGSNLDTKVAAVRDVAGTLARLLSEYGINHRDVKPENLYHFETRFVVGDFGLAKRPDDPNLTEGRPIGPYHHLPSEVFLADQEPAWERVDVYCLANTLWRLAVEKLYPPRGQIRATEDDSLSLAALADDLNGWLSARQTKDEFAATYENEQARNLAVLRWLVELVRREPVFDQMSYDIRELDAPSDVSGLSESEVGQALLELDEAGLVDAEPHHVMGRTLPAYFSPVYPTLYGVEQVEDVDAITARAAPLLRAFVDEQNWLALPKTQEPVEIAPDVTLPPAEAYFQMWVLEQQDLLTFERLHESGGHASFVDIRTTVAGKAWLYRLGGSASAD